LHYTIEGIDAWSGSPATAPARETPFRELELLARRLLRLLRERVQREEHLVMLAIGCEKKAVGLTVTVGNDLVDLAAEVLRDRDSFASHIRHRATIAAASSSLSELMYSLITRRPDGVR